MMATKHNKGLHARSMETIVFHCNLRITPLQKTFTGYSSQIRQWITNSKLAIFVVEVLILKFFFSF